MTDDDLQKAYERLAMLHTETMAELVETRERLDRMSFNWWRMLCHRLHVLKRKYL